MNKCILLAFAGLCALSACGSGTRNAEPPLAGARIGGPFTLVNQDGQTVSDMDFAGKWRAVYFGYSFCPDICPLDLQRLMQGYRLFAKDHPAEAAKLQPIFISVDPARDTPAVLKRYVEAFGAPLIGLTGTDAQLAAAAKAYGVYYAKRQEPGASDYLMDHSRATMLFDGEGKPIMLVRTDESAQAVAGDFAQWVR
jgi:protein SCO1/2